MLLPFANAILDIRLGNFYSSCREMNCLFIFEHNKPVLKRFMLCERAINPGEIQIMVTDNHTEI